VEHIFYLEAKKISWFKGGGKKPRTPMIVTISFKKHCKEKYFKVIINEIRSIENYQVQFEDSTNEGIFAGTIRI